MFATKCKMCEGDLNLVEGNSAVVCEYCGSQQTVPVADNEKKPTFTMGLKAEGIAVAFGESGFGQCDVNNWKEIIALKCYPVAGSMGIGAGGIVLICGANETTKQTIQDGKPFNDFPSYRKPEERKEKFTAQIAEKTLIQEKEDDCAHAKNLAVRKNSRVAENCSRTI